jgi:hypothetical protein
MCKTNQEYNFFVRQREINIRRLYFFFIRAYYNITVRLLRRTETEGTSRLDYNSKGIKERERER